jgi:hypothetical protein
MYVTHLLYESIEVKGTKVSIFKCASIPDEEDLIVAYPGQYKFENGENEFFEVYVSGSNKPFFSSKTEPTPEEIEFQLAEYNKSPILNFMKSIFS